MHTTNFTKAKSTNWLSSLVLISTLILGCTETLEPDPSAFGFEYYPMELGDIRIYHATTIRYNLDGSIDTARYLMKEIAEEVIPKSDGSSSIMLGRYSAEIDTDIWTKDSLWAVTFDNTKVVVSEATTGFIKLVFPVAENLAWDGNMMNSSDSEFYEIMNLKKMYSYDTLSYENTLTVVHEDLIDPAKITKDDYRIEVFASDIGLIHKLKIRINYCSTCVENGKIEDGFIFEQKLIELGKE